MPHPIMNSMISRALVLSTSCLLAACVSSGSGTLAHSTAKKVVYLRPSASERAPTYQPRITGALEAAGFKVVTTPGAPYAVSLEMSGGFGISCSIVLYREGVPVVSGRGVNTGFGTAIARDVAYDHVFSMAIRQFEQRLK